MTDQSRRRWPGIVLDGLCAASPACIYIAFSLAAAIEWNKLPDKLRANNILSQFKSHIKSFLFMTAFH